MAINSKNLYNVETINQTKRLSSVVGYNRSLFDFDNAYRSTRAFPTDTDPLAAKQEVINATKAFGSENDKVAALESQHAGQSLFQIAQTLAGFETIPEVNVRVVLAEYYVRATKDGDADGERYTKKEQDILPPIKMTITGSKKVQVGSVENNFADPTAVNWASLENALSGSILIGPGFAILATTWDYFSTKWTDAISQNESDYISRFPMQMNPDNSSLGYKGADTTYISGAFANASEDRSGEVFFFVYRPFNLDIAKVVGFTKIVIPTQGKNTDVNPFSNYTQTDVDFTLNKFFSQVIKLSKTTSHAQLQSACQQYLKASTIKRNEDDLITLHNELISKRDGDFGSGDTSPERQQVVDNIANTKDALKRFWASTVIVERFLENLNDQIKNMFDPSSVEANMNKNTTTGIFFNKYKTYFNAYYKLIPVSKTTKKKSTAGKLKEAQDEAVAKASTDVTANLAQQERDFNRLQAESQIIRISGTGVNQFSHGPFENTMSILDILRDEQPHPSFSKSVAVEETSGEQATTTSDSDTACSNVLKTIPKTTREAMKTALQAKKGQYLKKMFKELFSLKRLQNDPSFKVIGFFSGFGGINFAQFSSLSFDVGDFDASKFSETFNFSGLRSQLDGVLGIIDDLAPLNMANKYLAQINAAAGIFGAADTAVSSYLAKFGGEFDLKKYLSGASPEDLKKCPSIPKINAEIQNDENSTNETLDKQKDGLKAIMKDFDGLTSSIEGINGKIGSIDTQSALLDLDITDTNQLLSDIPSSRQKASRFDLGTTLSDDIVDVNIDIPFTQTVPTLEI